MNIHAQAQGRLLSMDKSGFGLQHTAQSSPALVAFVVFTFAWSWGLGFATSQIKPQSIALSTALLITSGFGPSIAAFAVVGAFSGGKGLCDWLARCLNWHVGSRWFAPAFLVPPVVMLIALGMHILLGGIVPSPIPVHGFWNA